MKRKMNISFQILLGALGLLGLVGCKHRAEIFDEPDLYGGPVEDFRTVENDSVR